MKLKIEKMVQERVLCFGADFIIKSCCKNIVTDELFARSAEDSGFESEWMWNLLLIYYF